MLMSTLENSVIGLVEVPILEAASIEGGNVIGWMLLAIAAEMFVHSFSDEAYESYKEGFEDGKNFVPGSNIEDC
jgi:hypothetical protein